jgi:hypothetical protein
MELEGAVPPGVSGGKGAVSSLVGRICCLSGDAAAAAEESVLWRSDMDWGNMELRRGGLAGGRPWRARQYFQAHHVCLYLGSCLARGVRAVCWLPNCDCFELLCFLEF